MGILAQGHSNKDRAKQGLYTNERAPIFPSMARACWVMLVLNLPAFENKKYTADDHFHGNGLHGKILTKKEPIRTLGFTLPYNKEGLFLENREWGYTKFIVLQCNQARKHGKTWYPLCSVFFFCWGVLVNEMQINMDKLITCI